MPAPDSEDQPEGVFGDVNGIDRPQW